MIKAQHVVNFNGKEDQDEFMKDSINKLLENGWYTVSMSQGRWILFERKIPEPAIAPAQMDTSPGAVKFVTHRPTVMERFGFLVLLSAVVAGLTMWMSRSLQ